MNQGPTDTDDEEEVIDDAYVDAFIANDSLDFANISRPILYKILLIGDKLIANMYCVLTKKEWHIVHNCYTIIIYYIYTKSSQDNKSRNARNFFILLTSKKFIIKGVKEVETRLICISSIINQLDLFSIVLSYISKTHDIYFYTNILSSYLVTDSTKLHLVEEFWKVMDLGNKYKDLIKISDLSHEKIKINKANIKKLIDLRLIAPPNIKIFLSYQYTLLKNEWIAKKEEIYKKRAIEMVQSPPEGNKRIKLE
jgi:hypothetical protein